MRIHRLLLLLYFFFFFGWNWNMLLMVLSVLVNKNIVLCSESMSQYIVWLAVVYFKEFIISIPNLHFCTTAKLHECHISHNIPKAEKNWIKVESQTYIGSSMSSLIYPYFSFPAKLCHGAFWYKIYKYINNREGTKVLSAPVLSILWKWKSHHMQTVTSYIKSILIIICLKIWKNHPNNLFCLQSQLNYLFYFKDS